MYTPKTPYAGLRRQYRKTLRRLAAALRQNDAAPTTAGRCRKLLLRLQNLARALRTSFTPVLRAACIAAALSSAALNAQTPKVIELTPATNSHVAASAANIQVSFSTQMSVTSLSATNIVIHGAQSAYLSTRGTFSGNPVRSFNPDNNLHVGELITVSVTGATSLGDFPLTRAQVFQFRVGVSRGNGVFRSSGFGSTITEDGALGDLDGDGDLDAIFATREAPNEVWLNNGNGTFTSSTFGWSAGKTEGIALGDIDNDGDLDAVFANSFQANEVWLNNGDATFISTSIGTGWSQDLALGDLDGDGDLDAVIANFSGQQRIWLNNGDATFKRTLFGESNSSYGIDFGDLDGDGDLDVVVANYNDPQEVWLNNGDGTFVSSHAGHTGGLNYGVEIGDIDNDGDLDAIIAGRPQSEVWLNNGDATFATSRFGPSIWGNDVAVGDIDHDGDLDAIISNLTGQQQIWINNGDGTFSTSEFGPRTNSSVGVAMGDIDGDGDIDAVISNYFSPQEIWKNREFPPFNPFAPRIAAMSPATNSHAAPRNADVNIEFTRVMTTAGITIGNVYIHGSQTGYLSTRGTMTGAQFTSFDPDRKFMAGELISVMVTGATSRGGTTITAPVLMAFRAGVDGGAAIFTGSDYGSGASRGLAFGDLDGDGDLDVVVANYNQAQYILLNNGDATFSSSTFGGFSKSTNVALGDLDNDGDLDAIIIGDDTAKEIWLNNGDATFTSSTFGVNNVLSNDIALGDLDNDGDLDAIITNFNRDQEVWLNNGNATFEMYRDGPESSSISRGIDLGDLDGDGDLDAIIANDNWAPQEIWYNNGDGSFNITTFGTDRSQDVAIGDLDGDGDLDAIISNYNQSSKLWRNNGDGTFAESNFGGFNPLWRAAELGDFDDDGDLDAVFANALGGNSFYVNDGAGTFSYKTSGGMGATASSSGVAVGDLDRDGDLDIMFANLNKAQRIWINQPQIPTITWVSPAAAPASAAVVAIEVRGTDFEQTTAQITTLDQLGNPAGTLALTPVTATRAQVSLEIPAGYFATRGTLTLTVGNQSGTTSTTISVLNDGPAISLDKNPMQIDEDNTTEVVVSIGDVWPGFAALTLTAPTADLTTIASITQLGATGAATTFRIVPVTNAFGSIDLDFAVSDGELQSTTTLSLEILPVNDPPTIAASIPVINMGKNSVTGLSITLQDVDTPFAALEVSATSSNPTLLPVEKILFSATAATMQMRLGPDCDMVGQSVVTVTVNDGDNERSTTILVSVLPGAPLQITGAACACVDAMLTYETRPVDTSASYVWAAEGGTIAAGQGGGAIRVIWDHETTVASLSVTRTVLTGCTSAATIQQTGKLVEASMDFAMVAGTNSTTLAATANDTATNPLILSVETPQHGSAQVSANSIVYTPTAGFGGSDSFHYIMQDKSGCTTAGLVKVFVQNTADDDINLEFVEREQDRKDGVRGLRGAKAAAVSPDGRFVYAAGFYDHSIAIFSRNLTTGMLSYQTRVRNGSGGVSGLKYVSDVKISADGTRLYAAGYGDNAIAVFNRDVNDGSLAFAERKKRGEMDDGQVIGGLKRPRRIAVSPDGRSIIATGYADHSLVLFRFNGVADHMDYHTVKRDGIEGVDGLKQALGAAFSPDGRHLYVAGAGDDAIAVFAHDEGDLTFIERLRDNVGGVDGLGTVTDVYVSPDGRHVYAAGTGENSITVFKRSPLGGRLTYVDCYKNGQGGITGLAGIGGLIVDDSGALLWAAAEQDNSLTVFKRNHSSGTLQTADQAKDGQSGFNGLAGAAMTALTTDGAYAYTPGTDDNAVAAVFRNRAPRAEDDEASCVDINGTVTINVLNNDADPDAHVLVITSTTDGTLGTTTITGGGTTVDYQAGASSGADQFTYKIEDGHGGSSTATVTINITMPKSGIGEGLPSADNSLKLSPNPALTGTVAEFTLHEHAEVRIHVTDLLGVRRLSIDSGALPSGTHAMDIDLHEATGARLPAGAYIVELEVKGNRDTGTVSRTLIVR